MDYTQLCFIFLLFVPGLFASMNIAKGKPATQSSNQNNDWGADKAVDGFYNKSGVDRDVQCECCSHTNDKQKTAWWQVDLKVTSRIQDTVKIFYRKNYNFRLAGFSLYLKNVTKSKGNLCHKHSGDNLPDPIQIINCSDTARYVYIYNERLSGQTYPTNYSPNAVLELCEVEVYGCPLFKYGNICNKTCSVGCNNISYVCDPNTGTCIYGCKDRFNGLRCDDCKVGFFGGFCNKSCSYGCRYLSCNRISGNCSNGCKNNFSGPQCKGCIDGKRGKNCNLDCSKNCFNRTCLQNNGSCVFGCNVNWTGSNCQECSSGLYGSYCDKTCSEGCKPGGCEKNSGNCNNGCLQGFDDEKCDSCIDGLFGDFCEQNCSENCYKIHCDRQTGVCVERCIDGWEGGICNVSITTQQSGLELYTQVSVTVGAILVIVMIVVLVIVLLRKRFSSGERTSRTANNFGPIDTTASLPQSIQRSKPTHLPQNSNTEKRSSIIELYENTAEVYYNLSVPGIPVKEIKDYISQKSREDFEKEYNLLVEGPQFPFEHGKKPNNKLKNRFQKAYCYDHSRVILKPIPGEADSDYINANYIDRVDTPRYYIATQGPKEETIREFWRMVWQVKSCVIIMLTNLSEKGKIKCSKYWPEPENPLTSNGLFISSEAVNEFASYTIREFRVQNVTCNETRKVIQYHFTAWPDHGTPDPIEIIVFAHKIISRKKDSSGPNIVHCSAGIGRTGTYLALDALLEYGKRTGRINIFEFVKNMRKDRMNMVQTLDQYIFLNEVFAEAFEFEDTSLSGESLVEYFKDFPDDMSRMSYRNSNQYDRIQSEFKTLQTTTRSHGDEEFKTALSKKNRNKNRPNCPAASDQYRPYINSRSPEGTNYINAVLLPSWKKKTGYAISHFPLLETAVDFWSLIIDHYSTTIILLDADSTEVDEWFPIDSYERDYGQFSVILNNYKRITENVQSYDFRVTERTFSNEVNGKAFTLTSWIGNKLPPSCEDILKIVERVDSWVESGEQELITVLCPDGVTASGLFCVVRDVINDLKVCGEIDIFQTVRKVKVRRKECISKFEQYRYCYEVVNEYLKSDNLYADC